MKKVLSLSVTLCAALILCMSGTAMAALYNQWYDGDRVVYDGLNDLYWYPTLTDFSAMTRAQQNTAINNLDYGGSSHWRMATYDEATQLKFSLAEMAENFIEWDFSHLEVYPDAPLTPDPTPCDRTLASPYLAWELEAQQYFTPTTTEPLVVFGLPSIVFNGRYHGGGWVNIGEFGADEFAWNENTGSDHWGMWNLATPSAPEDLYLTMIFNQDAHAVEDDALDFNLFGMGNLGLGAWAVSETCPTKPVPEPAIILLLGSGIIGLGLAGLRRRFSKQ